MYAAHLTMYFLGAKAILGEKKFTYFNYCSLKIIRLWWTDGVLATLNAILFYHLN